ncbi:MAG: hypothetical protein IPM38_04730 [Ignavibacteria bacterium]|nr:hypothetical protein [Ignavibacteria bacterium]
MKAIIIDKEVDDQDVFISYLNDPVKIFSNIKKINNLTFYKMINYAVIMAGGVGTRFWPKGNYKVPKQFLKITDDNDTLLQLAYKRLDDVFKNTHIFVVTNVIYKQEVKRQLPKIPDENIICEPVGRNTAPCIGLSCVFINRFQPKANVLVVAADHLIDDVDEFHRVIKSGLKFVNDNGGIVTLGIHLISRKPVTDIFSMIQIFTPT